MAHGRSRLGGAAFGLGIVAIGILFLLQNLGFFYIGQIWQFWPVLLIGMGLSHVLASYDSGRRVWGIFLAGIGVVFLLSNMGLLPPHVWNYIWPLGLVFWGAAMLLRGPGSNQYWERRSARREWRNQRRQEKWERKGWASSGYPGPTGNAQTNTDTTDSSQNNFDDASSGHTRAGGFHATTSSVASRLSEYAILGGVKRRIDSQEFEGGHVTAVMGGVELDLSRAGTKLPEVVIEANALLGGVELRVPADWDVVVRGMGILGGYEDATRPPVNMGAAGAPRPRLIVTGQALLGGVTVQN